MTIEEKIQKFREFLEKKINDKFDFNVEHWNNGNFDDSYNYGTEVGEQDAYDDCLIEFKKIFYNS